MCVIKVKVTLEQAMKAHRGNGGTALLFLQPRELDGGRWSIRDVSWEYSRENILQEREYSKNILRKIILREYLRIF
jgi:hypothetical protein